MIFEVQSRDNCRYHQAEVAANIFITITRVRCRSGVIYSCSFHDDYLVLPCTILLNFCVHVHAATPPVGRTLRLYFDPERTDTGEVSDHRTHLCPAGLTLTSFARYQNERCHGGRRRQLSFARPRRSFAQKGNVLSPGLPTDAVAPVPTLGAGSLKHRRTEQPLAALPVMVVTSLASSTSIAP